jgi:hypothetical protein
MSSAAVTLPLGIVAARTGDAGQVVVLAPRSPLGQVWGANGQGRVQVRLRGGVHGGTAKERSRRQLRARRPGGAAARGDECLRPPGRSGPSHLLDLRAASSS